MVEVTKLNGDGDIDVRGTLIVSDVIRVTTSDSSAGAIKEAAQPDKSPHLSDETPGIGVHRSTPDLFEIDEEFAGGGD